MADGMDVMRTERSVVSIVGMETGLTADWSAVSETMTMVDYQDHRTAE